jgi:hypothetical protein
MHFITTLFSFFFWLNSAHCSRNRNASRNLAVGYDFFPEFKEVASIKETVKVVPNFNSNCHDVPSLVC